MIWGRTNRGKSVQFVQDNNKWVGISTKHLTKPQPVVYCHTFSMEQEKKKIAQLIEAVFMEADQELVCGLIMTKELVDNPVWILIFSPDGKVLLLISPVKSEQILF